MWPFRPLTLLSLLLLLTMSGMLVVLSRLHNIERSSSTSGSRRDSIISSTVQAECHQQLRQHAEEILAACPGLPGLCPRPANLHGTGGDSYRVAEGPNDAAMAQQKALVDDFVAGQGLKDRIHNLQQLPDKRGILISAGKPHHVGNAAIILHALRRGYGCTLPIEIAYRGDKEIDPETRRTLSQAFQPLFWLDLDSQQYPRHHYSGYSMDRYEPKIYALYHSRLQQVLMLDADNLPLRDPTYLFASPHNVQHGNMFWVDLWSPELSSTTFIGHDSVYRLLGLNKHKYWEVLSGGQGWMQRAAESGQLVLDRVRHADVLEYLWWLTSFSSVLYKHVLGDKDTFGFAFAMAGKLPEMYAVAVPPAAAFKHEGTHWRFQAMLQYDHLGQPTFFHRTFEKWNDVLQPPPFMTVVSGPLPNRFIVSYLGNRSVALAPDVPLHALRPVSINCPAPSAKYVAAAQSLIHNDPAGHTSSSGYISQPYTGNLIQGCTLTQYLEYQQLQHLGLPISRQPALEAACKGLQQQLQALGSSIKPDQALNPTRGLTALTAANSMSTTEQQQRNTLRAQYTPQVPYTLAHRRILDADVWVGHGVGHGAPQVSSTSMRRGSSCNRAAAGHGSQESQQLLQQQGVEVSQQQYQTPLLQSRVLQADEHAVLDSMDSSVSGPAGCSGEEGGSMWGRLDAAVLLQACRSQRAKPASESVQLQGSADTPGTMVSAAGGQGHQNGLPQCEDVAWDVARCVLPQYAEQVARDEAGNLLRDPDPQLPVLQLALSGLGSAKGLAAGQQCGLLSEALSPLDVMQHKTIPNARRWVEQQTELPALKQSRGR